MLEYENTPTDQEFYYSNLDSQTAIDSFLCDDKWAKSETIDELIYNVELVQGDGSATWD